MHFIKPVTSPYAKDSEIDFIAPFTLTTVLRECCVCPVVLPPPCTHTETHTPKKKQKKDKKKKVLLQSFTKFFSFFTFF